MFTGQMQGLPVIQTMQRDISIPIHVQTTYLMALTASLPSPENRTITATYCSAIMHAGVVVHVCPRPADAREKAAAVLSVSQARYPILGKPLMRWS